ncbi:MAG: recombination regulator RecX [Treponemataceae bacterium]|nr:recombination regulator RecX [Treponemataceae bacterium]
MYTLTAVKNTAPDVYQLTFLTLPPFYLRLEYLDFPDHAGTLTPNTTYTDEAYADLIQAGLAFAAERKALEYLNRSEHSRFGLTRKLTDKGHNAAAICKACDYLEGRNWLSDRRFAESFLRNRSISRAEGRTRLLGELTSRGIDRHIANEALDAFFEEKDEAQILERAVDKLRRQGKKEEALERSLLRLGFSYKDIKRVLSGTPDE